MVKLPLLAGEIELENGKMATGTIVLTDYRLLLCFSDDHNLSLPIGLIDEVVKNYQSLNIYTKQARLIVCTFETIQDCHYWSKRITEAMGELCKLENLFTFKYFSALESSSNHHQKQQQQQQQEQQQQQQQPPQPPQQQQPVSQENQRQEEQEESKIEEHIHNHNEVREKVENGDDEKKHMSKLKPNYSLNPVNIEDSLIYYEFKRLKFNEDPWNNEVDDADNKECVEEEEEDEEIENDRRIARQCANDTGNDFRDPDRPALWRISEANINFEVCSSYPRFLIVPADIKDEDLATVAKFRYQNRVPAIVWRSVKNGCIIARSSQPYVGWWGSRCDMDEKLLQSIVKNTMKHSSNNGAPTTTSTTASTTATATATLNPDSVSETRTEGETVSASGGTEEASDEQQQQPSNSSGGAADCCKKLLVIDARSYAAAMINRAKGGGVECAEYYSCCEVQFMGLANIHSIRKSFNAIRYLCEYSSDSENWNTFLTNSKWLIHISSLLKSAMIIVDAIKDNRSVLVHCSDGWDRTPQIVSLAELMLDPFYRTWDGFRILIDKEWCEFGHKFADRCGISSEIDDPYERCPVFLQWLDCVHQIVNQLENHFEFNVQLLETLLLHTYSCLYGTFLCNSVNERVTKQIYLKTPSIWSHLSSNKERFINKNFSPPTKGDDYIVTPSPEVKDLRLWTEVFAPSTNDVIKSGNLDLIN